MLSLIFVGARPADSCKPNMSSVALRLSFSFHSESTLESSDFLQYPKTRPGPIIHSSYKFFERIDWSRGFLQTRQLFYPVTNQRAWKICRTTNEMVAYQFLSYQVHTARFVQCFNRLRWGRGWRAVWQLWIIHTQIVNGNIIIRCKGTKSSVSPRKLSKGFPSFYSVRQGRQAISAWGGSCHRVDKIASG